MLTFTANVKIRHPTRSHTTHKLHKNVAHDVEDRKADREAAKLLDEKALAEQNATAELDAAVAAHEQRLVRMRCAG